MPAWSSIALAAACGLAGAAGAEEIVDWRDAAQCIGRVCSVRGTVAVVEDDGQSTRLYFDPQDRRVRVLLMHGWLVTWPSYAGHTIIATGKVDRFRDHVELILLAPSNIEVVGGLPTATPSAAPVPTDTVAPSPSATVTLSLPSPTPSIVEPTPAMPSPSPEGDEVDRLRERVRELEERVRELEGP